MQLYFHIGFHKTATTFFQKNIFSDKKTFNLLNNYKRPWDDEIIRYLVLTPYHKFKNEFFYQIVKKKYLDKKINIISAERLSGHPISGGYDSYDIAKKIQKSFPNAKIIINVRSYKEFKLSCYKQSVKEGYCGKFKHFGNNNYWKTFASNDKYFRQKDFLDYIKELFEAESILKQNFEDFISNPKDFINKMSLFLGYEIDFYSLSISKVANKTFSNRKIRAIRITNFFRKSELNPFPLISLNSKIIKLINLLIFNFLSNKPLNN